MHKVLLISSSNWESLFEIPVIIKNAGCTVDIFSPADTWVLQNQFYDKWIPGNEDPNQFLEELLEFVDKEGNSYDWIIPGDDIIIRLLNEKITSESLFYKLMPLTKIENREILGSKAGFSKLCSKYNIKTPKYLLYDQGLTNKYIGDHLGYPLLIKIDKSEGGYGVFLCNDESALDTHLKKK